MLDYSIDNIQFNPPIDSSDMNLDGIDVPQEDLDALFEIDPALWLQETDLTEEFYRTFDGKIPPALYAELATSTDETLAAIAAIVMRSRLIDSSKASSKTRIVATAFTGRIKTHAVTATVTII